MHNNVWDEIPAIQSESSTAQLFIIDVITYLSLQVLKLIQIVRRLAV